MTASAEPSRNDAAGLRAGGAINGTAMRETADLTRLVADQPVETLEGMSVDHLCRGRLQYLAAQDRSLVSQTQFADAKAAAVMTVMGVVIWGNPATAPGEEVGLLATLSLLASAAAILAAMWSAAPRYPNTETRAAMAIRDLYSWPSLASDAVDGDDYAGFMLRTQHAHLVASMARSNAAVSAILLRKFRALRVAFAAAATALVFLAADVFFFS